MHKKIDELMTQSGVGFGTSGARGTVEAMTDPVCYAYTRAFLQALEAQGVATQGTSVVIAGDLRPSTPRIMNAVAAAVHDAGYTPVNAGFLPSPAVACYAMAQGWPSIMVTGSHIPDDRNGIKFNRPDGEILKDDEALIRQQTVDMPTDSDIDAEALPAIDPAAEQHYLERYRGFFASDDLAGLKVGLYEHSGVGRDILNTLLTDLGADVVRLARSEQFIPVDTEAIREEDIKLARQWSAEHKLDTIVSTDGDADRPLIADENGHWLRGDIVGILCADFLGIEAVVTPVSSNSAVEKSGLFKRVDRTRIGSPFVIAQMQQAMAGFDRVAGYEANGGFLLASDVERGGNKLTALPTRDAVLPILSILVNANRQGVPVSALVSKLPPRYTASGPLKNVPTDLSQARIGQLSGDPRAIEHEFGALCGKVKQTDTTDGLRITFENEEIIHLRPSGNAPELRCYNEADTPERAETLNQACLTTMQTWTE